MSNRVEEIPNYTLETPAEYSPMAELIIIGLRKINELVREHNKLIDKLEAEL